MNHISTASSSSSFRHPISTRVERSSDSHDLPTIFGRFGFRLGGTLGGGGVAFHRHDSQRRPKSGASTRNIDWFPTGFWKRACNFGILASLRLTYLIVKLNYRNRRALCDTMISSKTTVLTIC